MEHEGPTLAEGEQQESFLTYSMKAATAFLTAVDYIGESAADFLGITSSRYQYVLDAYERHMDEMADEDRTIQMGIERQRQREEESRRNERDSEVIAMQGEINLEDVPQIPGHGSK